MGIYFVEKIFYNISVSVLLPTNFVSDKDADIKTIKER